MLDDITRLVDLTFDQLEKFKDSDPFAFGQKEKISLDQSIAPSEVPGILYHVQVKGQVFVVRIFESSDLSKDFTEALKYPEHYPSLRLIEEDDSSIEEKLRFFECDTLSIAKNVKQHLGNKRFPLYEEHVFNVSDPADSWWLQKEGSEISLSFKLAKTQKTSQMMKIGPLGDAERATKKLTKLAGYFSLLFPVESYSCAHGTFYLKTRVSSHPFFKDFVALLSGDQVGHDFWMYLVRLEIEAEDIETKEFIQEANFFLMELSVMRRFWKQVTGLLGLQ